MERVALVSRRTSLGICLIVLCSLFAISDAASASPHTPAGSSNAFFADADGDGIADEFDPDDDNDGVADIDDSNPTSPGSSSPTGPDILDPGKDSDGDGISNVLDPDDNNNGKTDEEDVTSPPPVNNGGGSSQSPGSDEGSATRSEQPTNQGDSPMQIRALPVTGSGSIDGSSGFRVMAAVLVVAGAAWIIWRHGAHLVAP